jgi:hypothetical protein
VIDTMASVSSVVYYTGRPILKAGVLLYLSLILHILEGFLPRATNIEHILY